MQKPPHTGNPPVLLQPRRNQRKKVNVSRINEEEINVDQA
jgi:hypothetical protein